MLTKEAKALVEKVMAVRRAEMAAGVYVLTKAQAAANARAAARQADRAARGIV